jgi:hypothetical protein
MKSLIKEYGRERELGYTGVEQAKYALRKIYAVGLIHLH